jgi:phage baseplate assembly protein W
MMKKRSFLGIGWGFNTDEESKGINLDSEGRIQTARYEESVRQSIWIILSTARGERLMRHNFGCGIHDLVFSSSNASVKGDITNSIRKSLVNFEPRINLRNIEIQENGARMNINISYEVIKTNNVFNLVYPFYVQDGAE